MANRKNTFLLKRSNVVDKVPSLGDIQLGELALNTADAKLFSTYTGGLTGATEIREIGWDRLSTISGGTVNGTLNATTILSGGTNLLTIIESLDTNTFVSGGTYNDTTNNINFSGNSLDTTFDVDLTDLVSSVSGDTFVVGGTYVDSTNTIALLRNDGNFVNVTGVTNTYVTGGTVSPATDNSNAGSIGLFYKDSDGIPRTLPFEDTYTSGTTFGSNEATLTRNDGTEIFKLSGGTNVTLSNPSTNQIKLDVTIPSGMNTFVTGFTYNDNNTFTIFDNVGGSFPATINQVSGLTVNGILSASTYTGITLNSLDDVTTGIPVTPNNSYQGRLLYFDVVSNEFISTEEYGSIGTVTIWGKKGSAGTIDKGLPVYITGFDDDIHQVELANATTATTMPVIGFTGDDFDDSTTNPIITFGKITGLDTTSAVSTINPNGETWSVNDVLYMNTTDGGLTKNRPSGTNTQIQRIAKVLKVNSNGGQLFIFNTARTAGLPNLATDYLWVGDGDDTPQEVIRTDVGITTTGFTYDNNNTFTITDDNGGSLSTTFNQVSGLTVNGTLSATTISATTYYGDGSNLTGVGGPSIREVTGTTTFATANETVNCTSGTFVVNLPTAVGIQGTTYTLINSGTGIITLDPSGSETINGSLTIDLKRQYISRTVQSNGLNWIVI